jgi:hypothetical protein
MSTRLDNELKQITESIQMLNNHVQTPGSSKSQREVAKRAQTKKIIVVDTENDKFPDPTPLDNSGGDLRLNDPKGFEDRLMSRVKDALKAIIDQ